MDKTVLNMLLMCFLVTCILVGNINAQVFYTEGDIRLTGPQASPTQGILEIIHNNVWGTVCSDHFDMKDAQVVCRQLKHLPPINITYLGSGTGPIWLDDVACDSTEQRLEDCLAVRWNNSNCDHTQDVGIVCSPATTPNPGAATTARPNASNSSLVPWYGYCPAPSNATVRLLGPSPNNGIGVVQVLRNNVWGTVCDNGGWDFNEAKVICRMLCASSIYAVAGSAPFDTSTISEPATIHSVVCNGTETDINSCRPSPWSINSCGQNEFARATCVPMNDLPAVSMFRPAINCTCCELVALFSLANYPNLQANQLAVNGSQPCNIIPVAYANYINITIRFDQCGTRTMNSTHIIYSFYISYVPALNGIVTTVNTYGVLVQCEIFRNNTVSKPVIPLTQSLTLVTPGYFKVFLHFFRNNTFETVVPSNEYPVRLLAGEWLNAALELKCYDPNLKIIATNCLATPTADRFNPVQYPLFTNKCANDPTLGFFPINDTWSGFRYQTFKFIGPYDEVHIHCDAYICGNTETQAECDRSCFSGVVGRRKRSVDFPVMHVSSPALIIIDPNDITSPIMNKETRPAAMKEVLVLAMALAVVLISA